MLGLLLGIGVAALGTFLLCVTVGHALNNQPSGRPPWVVFLTVVQPILLIVPLGLLAAFRPEQLLHAGIGVTLWYIGYAIAAGVRMGRKARPKQEEE